MEAGRWYLLAVVTTAEDSPTIIEGVGPMRTDVAEVHSLGGRLEIMVVARPGQASETESSITP
jgi:hypothetical protein